MNKSGEEKIEVAASILSADFRRLGERVGEALQAGVRGVHVDVMDGHFVPNGQAPVAENLRGLFGAIAALNLPGVREASK